MVAIFILDYNRRKLNHLGFYVRPGTETLVAMVASRSITTKQSIDFFTPAKRMCYTDAEFSPLFYNEVGFEK